VKANQIKTPRGNGKGDIVMKRIFAIALFAASSLAVVGNLSAQDHRVNATIPFDFTLNKKVLPAGSYIISSLSANAVEVRNVNGHIAELSAVRSGDKQSTNPVLVFQKYGNQYFLSEVLGPSSALNVVVPRSKREQRVRREEATLQESSQILIALR
jgi:hypothetical protein